MVEIDKLRIRKFPEISDSDPVDGDDPLSIDVQGYDSDEELYEIVENDTEAEEREFYQVHRDLGNESRASLINRVNFENVNKVQEVLGQISLSWRRFIGERLDSMERNIFRLNNGGPPEVENFQDAPMEVRTVAYLLAQGDNRNVEELLRTVHQNVVVNVNLSYYFKIMLVMLTFNTLLLFKWLVWDQLEELP
ncbi:hypothetical protein NQ317_005608 [Molorchus minor]|uniref:Uncharacterized protein n=1 Tax=Molorchus minor TaxID=1323400 RepID=A0ABQ9K682_9CUCU|nr:hypothetical protein NQ317_005608 [Molorchus minor]